MPRICSVSKKRKPSADVVYRTRQMSSRVHQQSRCEVDACATYAIERLPKYTDAGQRRSVCQYAIQMSEETQVEL
jgi:hypothetical protein